jgi:hypothetical protein
MLLIRYGFRRNSQEFADNYEVVVLIMVMAEDAKCAGIITQQPYSNWQKEHYRVVVRRDLIGSGIRRSLQVVIKW